MKIFSPKQLDRLLRPELLEFRGTWIDARKKKPPEPGLYLVVEGSILSDAKGEQFETVAKDIGMRWWYRGWAPRKFRSWNYARPIQRIVWYWMKMPPNPLWTDEPGEGKE
jgi:hypothetical protein